MSYSLDFRKKILSLREKEALSMAAVALRFGVGKASVMRWSKRLEAKKTRNKPPTKLDMAALAQDVENHPDAYHNTSGHSV